jgi:hypothetical protein
VYKTRESRERKKKRHLDDLFSSEYVESTIDEKKKRRRKKKERRETRGNFDKSLASQALCLCDMLAGTKTVCHY